MQLSHTHTLKSSFRTTKVEVGNLIFPIFKLIIFIALILSPLLSGLVVRAQGTEEVKEYYLKAVFIYNTTRTIDWGSYARGNEFEIGVLGSSPITLPLIALANTGMAGNRKVVIHEFKYPYEISFTNVLFITRDYAFPLSSFLPMLPPGTLTVGEEEGIAEEGIALNLIIDDNRLKYSVNAKAIASAGLTASPELLQYAMIPSGEVPQYEASATHALPVIYTKKELPVIRDRDYPEGLTEEIITEPKMIIYRTVIKQKSASVIFQKIAYDWGGVFYFKNSSSISENTYTSEIKKAKTTLEKDKAIQ